MTTTPEHEQAAQKRAAALKADQPRGLVEALLAERQGYVTRGLSDRVKQVDAALEAAGYVDPDAKPEPRRSRKSV